MIGHRTQRLFLCALIGCVSGCATTAPVTPAPVVLGRGAPDFTAAQLDGAVVRLSSLRGRVVVLDVWAAWCEGCEKDLPALDEMAMRLQPSGVEVVAVSLDEDRKRLDSIVSSRTWRMTVLHDPSGRVGELYQPEKMPAIFIIDRTGKVRHARYGLTPQDLAAIEGEARTLAR